MAVKRSLPYLACHFRVFWNPGEAPAGDGGFSEVLIPPLAVGPSGSMGGPVTGATPPGLGAASVGTGAGPVSGSGAMAGFGPVPGAGAGAEGSGAGGGTGGGIHAAAGDAPRLVLRRGFTGSLEIYHWCEDARAGREDHIRTVGVDLLDGESGRVVCSWEFTRARPEQLDYSPLRALDGAVLVETLSLSFERMTMK